MGSAWHSPWRHVDSPEFILHCKAGHARSNRAYGGGEGTPVQTAPMSPLSNYAEQLQRDLGSSTGSLPPQPPQFQPCCKLPSPFWAGHAQPGAQLWAQGSCSAEHARIPDAEHRPATADSEQARG